MRHTASSLVSTQSPQQPASRTPQGHCLTASGVRLSDCVAGILGHTPLHQLPSQRAKTSLSPPLGCPGNLAVLCYANSDPQEELVTAPSGWCSHSLWLTSLSPGQGQSLLQTPGRKPCAGSPGPCPRQGSRARRGRASTDLRWGSDSHNRRGWKSPARPGDCLRARGLGRPHRRGRAAAPGRPWLGAAGLRGLVGSR